MLKICLFKELMNNDENKVTSESLTHQILRALRQVECGDIIQKLLNQQCVNTVLQIKIIWLI